MAIDGNCQQLRCKTIRQHSGVRGAAAACPVCPCGPACSSAGGWASGLQVGPHTGGGGVGGGPLLGSWGCRGAFAAGGEECQRSAGCEVNRPPPLCSLSLSSANETRLDALEPFPGQLTRGRGLAKAAEQDRLVFFLFFCVFPSPLATPTLPRCSRCYVHYVYQNSFWG